MVLPREPVLGNLILGLRTVNQTSLDVADAPSLLTRVLQSPARLQLTASLLTEPSAEEFSGLLRCHSFHS